MQEIVTIKANIDTLMGLSLIHIFYVSGSLNVFNHETNVDLNRRLVCLDLKKLGAGLRTIG